MWARARPRQSTSRPTAAWCSSPASSIHASRQPRPRRRRRKSRACARSRTTFASSRPRKGGAMKSSVAAKARHLHFPLAALPFAEDALEPVLSAETLTLHHSKHHRKYVDTMNELLQKTQIDGSSLEDVVRSSKGKLFNNAAQAWNHDF